MTVFNKFAWNCWLRSALDTNTNNYARTIICRVRSKVAEYAEILSVQVFEQFENFSCPGVSLNEILGLV